MRPSLVTKLQEGETVKFRPHGNSMTPRIRSGQLVTVEPVQGEDVNVGDVVLARVKGVLRLHKVSAIEPAKRRVQISNNHGFVNGWCSYEKVYGIVTEIQ